MGILLAIAASLFAAISNLSMKKSIGYGGTSKAFLMIQLSCAALFSSYLGPIRAEDYSFNIPVLWLGMFTGILFAFLMFFMGKAIEKGPPGLTIATLNASTIMPGLIMALIYGVNLGFEYHFLHALGSLLVLGGLFWAGSGFRGMQNLNLWLVFSLIMFFLHILFLVIMQYRAMIINHDNGAFFLTRAQATSSFFLPIIYIAASLFHMFLFFFQERRFPKKAEYFCGLVGGICNATCVFFLIWSTELASPLENAMIFPMFSVGVIILCNTWGKWLYQEQVNWKACHLCVTGLILGTVDWSKVMAFLKM